MKRLLLLLILCLWGTAVSIAQPTVTSTNPGGDGHTSNASFSVTFSEAMDNTTITTDNIFVHGSYRGYYTGSFSQSTNTYTFSPDSAFYPNERITVTVTTGVENSSDVAMTSPFSFTYRKRPASSDGEWKAAVNYTVSGNYTEKSVLSDVNGDGVLDVITITPSLSKLTVFINNGDGTFGSGTDKSISVSPDPFDIIAADIDNDGDADLMTANGGVNNSSSLSVFINDGTGSFADGVNYENPGMRTAAAHVAVDLDADGFLDIVQSNSADDSLYVFTNSGTGTFNNVVGYAANGTTGDLAYADVDEDGDLDIITVDGTNNRIEVYTNDGSGILSYSTNYFVGTTPVALEFAGFGGKPDVMVVNSVSDNVTLRTDNSGAPLLSSSTISVGNEPYTLSLGDFDADGDIDAVVGNNVDKTLSLLTNNGSEVFTETTYSMGATYANHVKFGDIDEDGDLDIVTANQDGSFSVIKNYSGGNVSSVTPSNGAKNIAVSSNIDVVFDEEIDAATLTSANVKVVGSITGPVSSAISFNAGTKTATINPNADFLPGETISVVVTRGVESTIGVALEKPFYASFTAAASAGGAFATKTDFSSGTNPSDAVMADVDGDGDLDMITINTSVDSLSVLINNGSGFNAPVLYAPGDAPVSVAAGDVDGDGDIDLVVSVSGENVIARFLNNGSGNFGTRTTFATGSAPGSVVLADRDLDGDLDLVYVNGSTPAFQSNNGSGTFSGETSMSGTVDGNLIPADIDGDGDLDFLSVRAGTSRLLAIKKDPTYYSNATYIAGSGVKAVAAGDFDGDGDIDAVTVNESASSISYFANNGSGAFAAKVDVAIGSSVSPDDLLATDIEGDGDLDIIVTGTGSDEIITFLNNGSATFTKDAHYATGDEPVALLAADLNSDNVMDIITANGTGNTISKLLGGTALSISSLSPSANALDVAANSNVTITFNTDVVADSVSTSNIKFYGSFTGEIPGALSYDSGTKTATFNPTSDFKAGEVVTVSVSEDVITSVGIGLPAMTYSSFFVATSFEGSFAGPNSLSNSSGGSAAKGARLADMDGDGDLDYVRLNNAASGNPGNVTILKNNGSGTFGSEVAYNLGGTAGSRRMELTDVDLDGDLDAVVLSTSGSNGLHILLNDGAGALGTATVYTFSANWLNFIEVGDITGDGYPDVLINTYGSGLVRFDNDGDGTFTAATNLSTSNDVTMRTADVDGDGDLDILSGDWDGKNLQVLKNDGSGTFASAVNYTATSSSNPYYMEVGDLDGDGDIDAVIANDDESGVQTLSSMINDGTGAFTKSAELNLGDDQPNNIQLYDIDGDGDLDVLAAFNGQGIGIYYNNGSGTFGNLFKPSTSGTYNNYFTDITAGDINGDGDLDFIAVHNQPSYNYIYNNQAPTEPTEESYDLAFSKNYGTQVTLSWSNGDGEKRLVLVKQGGAVDSDPADQTNYTANAEFGSGAQIGTGNYVVYNGTGSTVDVTGLSLNTAYHFEVVEYNGASGYENYYTTATGTGNVTTNEVTGIGSPEAGSAISFSGSGNSYLRMSMDTLPSAAFTIETWVKPGATGADQVIASYGRNDEFVVGINASNQFYASHVNTDPNASSGGEEEFKIRSGNSPKVQATATVTGSTTISANQWYHVAVTAEKSGNLILYVNGTQESSTGLSFVQIDQSYWYPGADYNETKLLTGVIDEMRMWSVARSVSEIRDLMYRTYQDFGENMLGYWQFNEGTGSTAGDRLGNYNANVYAGASWTTSDVPVGNGSTNSASSITSGTNTVGNATIELTDAFDSGIDVQVTEVEDSPNTYPSGYTSGIGGKYFVINLFGDPGTFSANITLTFGSGVITSAQQSDPSTLKLYKRSSNATGTWTSMGGATTAVASTGAVTWTGITSFSQFMAVEGDPYDLIQLADNSDVVAYDDSVFVFGSSFFNLNDNYADSTLKISVNTTPSGTLFIDKNANSSYDSGTDTQLTSGGGEQDYTPSGSEKLIYSSSTLGYETVTITLKSTDYTDSVPLELLTVEGSPVIAGTDNQNEWKLITNPFTTTIGTLLDSIWTQGAVNSNAPNGDATIYRYSSETSEFSTVTTDLDTTKVRAGEGLAVYMFAFDDYAVGIPADGGWPKTLSNYGTPHGTSVDLTLKNVDNDATSGTSGDEGWVLVGNPFGWALSADSVIASIKRDDASANNYLYRWNASTDQYDFFATGAVQPYEAVFARVETSGATANITLDQNDKHSSGSKEVHSDLFALQLAHPESGNKSAFYVDVDNRHALGIDSYDAYYRNSLAQSYAHLYTKVGDQRLMLNALPASLEEEVEFPLHLDANISGAFTLTWNAEMIPEGWELLLRDEQTDALISLNGQEAMSFTTEKQSAKQSFVSALTAASNTEARFTLIVRSDIVTSLEEADGIPARVELYQNYPNPFNPATIIKFGVPEATNVRLEVFDVLGRRVKVLMDNEMKAAGRYTVPFDAKNLASGIYFYRLTAGQKIMMNQMTLIK